ncbi:MAG: proteasome accessory factor PafA2 family protein [Candidatus Bipolaricaulia bacterium]
MERLMGTEIEYGLYIDGVDLVDLVDEARAVVASWPGQFAAPWDYSRENPLRDLRGGYASRLATDPRDDRYERPSSRRLTPHENHVDLVLPNGARLYQDHGHPEYSTPECRSLFDLVAHERAGERIVRECARRYARRTHHQVTLYKNNTDFHGMSYGAHENYLVRRDVPFEQLLSGILPFLVTRQIFAGAGKVGVEGEKNEAGTIPYQLSQRADFFTELAGVDTLYKRPLINTRDEPHADPARFRRFHVIAGDANMSEYALALKLGTTALVLSLIESGWGPNLELKAPVQAVRHISRDPTWRWEVELTGGRTMPAVEIQRVYLEAAQERYAGQDGEDEEADWVLREWEAVLDGLETDPERLADRLDWVAKQGLLASFIEAEGLDWSDERLLSLDLAYHDLEPERGLYSALEADGAVRRVTTDEQIRKAIECPPADTRAYLRGLCVSQLGTSLRSLTWSRIVLDNHDTEVVLDLSDWVDDRVATRNRAFADAEAEVTPVGIKQAIEQPIDGDSNSEDEEV